MRKLAFVEFFFIRAGMAITQSLIGIDSFIRNSLFASWQTSTSFVLNVSLPSAQVLSQTPFSFQVKCGLYQSTKMLIYGVR